MLFLHHPYAVNHLAILEQNTQSLCYYFDLKIHPFTFCVFMYLCSCSSMCAHLVIRDLLQVKMGGVDHLHAGVAVVCATQSTPVFGVWIELVCLLPAAL